VVDHADGPAEGIAPRSVPGLLTSRSMEEAGANALVSGSWAAEAAINHQMFEHRAFGSMLLHHAMQAAAIPMGGSVETDELYAQAAEALVQAITKSGKTMPAELRKRLRGEQVDIVEALIDWYATGGPGESVHDWDWRSASKGDKRGMANVKKRHSMAKRWQAKLDVLAAACLYTRPHSTINAIASKALD